MKARSAIALLPLMLPVTDVGAQSPPRLAENLLWVFPEDYPRDDVVAAQNGPTRVLAAVSATGAISDCRRGASNGSPTLDRLACTILARHDPMIPARDENGRDIPSTYVGDIRWGMPIGADAEEPDDGPRSLTLYVDGQGKPVECGINKVRSGIQLPMDNCAQLVGLLPHVLQASPTPKPYTLVVQKGVAKGTLPDLFPGDDLLYETQTRYAVDATGHASDCRTTTTGSLKDVVAMPTSPCDISGGRKVANGATASSAIAFARVMTTPVLQLPLRRYLDDITLVSDPGNVASTCTGTVGREEESLNRLCGYLKVTVDRLRVRTANKGWIEAHFRAAAKYGTEVPAPLPVPAGETLDGQSFRTFRIDEHGGASDCTDTIAGFSAGNGVHACQEIRRFDSSTASSAGNPLWMIEEVQYTFRLLSSPGEAR